MRKPKMISAQTAPFVHSITRNNIRFGYLAFDDRFGTYLHQTKINERLSFYSDGLLIKEYKYPRIERKFSSPLVNYFNLHFDLGFNSCGFDYGMSLIDRIGRLRRKAYGWILLHDDEENCLDELIKAAQKFDLYTHSFGLNEPIIGVCVALKDTFGELFDLVALQNDYVEYIDKIPLMGDRKTVKDILECVFGSLADVRVSDYIDERDDDTGLVTTIDNYILPELVLGYPIETTLANACTFFDSGKAKFKETIGLP